MSDTTSPSLIVQPSLFEDLSDDLIINWDDFLSSQDSSPWKLSNGVFLVKSENYAEVVVSGYGVKLSKKNERLSIKENDKLYFEIPFFRISHISVQSRGVSLSSDLIEECSKRGIIITFNSFNGKPYAIISSPNLNAVIKTRREQIKAYSDRRGLLFSKTIVEGKINNQMALLKYAVKNSEKKELIDFVKESLNKMKGALSELERINGENIDSVRNKIFPYEAFCAKLYWDCFREIISKKINFEGREKRGSVSPVNSLLNYGYGMLYSVMWGAILNSGLEPFAGFLHVDEPGRPSLILDMVEEFRAPVIDRVVISHINTGGKVEIENGLLTVSTRKDFSQKVIERFESYDYYKGKRFKIKSIIQIQARNVASFFREGKEYKSFSFKW